MIIHAYSQAIAAFGPASFQHFTSVGSCHARPKTVDTHTAADFWLIGSLGHFTSYSLIKVPLNSKVEAWLIPRCLDGYVLDETRLYRMLRFCDSSSDMNLLKYLKQVDFH